MGDQACAAERRRISLIEKQIEGDIAVNIKDAKEQIRNAIIAYFTKDEYGEYQG